LKQIPCAKSIALDRFGRFYKKAIMTLSVALCTCNGERYLLEQLQSIARQTRLPDELVVCDDASEDDTAAVIGRFAERAGFKISLCQNVDRLGVTQNFARAFSLCSGDIIVPCDQDDLWDPAKLAVLEEAFRNQSDLLMAFHDLALIGTKGEDAGPTPSQRTQWKCLGFGPQQQTKLNRGEAFPLLLRSNVITGAAVAFRRPLLQRALPIPDRFVHDEWLGLVAAATGRILSIDRPLVRYRQHDAQAIGAAATALLAQYRYARANMDRAYFVRMLERTQSLQERLRANAGAVLHPKYHALVSEKRSHAQARLRMRDQTLIRWPLAFGEAFRGRYGRFGYGLKSFLQDLVL
jgi:glycosyltransferase involved in cell wall biosynthesis